MPLTALSNITSAPAIGAQTRLYLAAIDTTAEIPHSGLPTLLTGTPPSGVDLWNTDYVPLGCVKTNKITYPVRGLKPIPCGLEAARWMVPARAELGSLDLTCLDFPEEPNDAVQFINTRCVAALVTEDHDGNELRIEYCVDWQPKFEKNTPEGDGETEISMSGPFSRLVLDSNPTASIDEDIG